MAPAEEEVRKRAGRKLTKRNKPPHRIPSTQIPESLRHGGDEQEDVTAPVPGPRGNPQFMNQSIFSIIAAAGTRTDFNARFDESSESEDESQQQEQRGRRQGPRQSPEDERQVGNAKPQSEQLASGGGKHKRKLSERRLLQSLPKLSLSFSKAKEDTDSGTRTHFLNDLPSTSTGMKPQDAPMMSRMLTAEAKLDEGEFGGDGPGQSGGPTKRYQRRESSPATLLAVRLMEIFGFETPEKVVSEYPCWLLQSVLLQGYMYITQKHICFYAYLPKRSSIVAKSGYLAKRGRQNPKYNRYWFTLKGDVLSYYSNPSDLYFPKGNIDLRYGISATLANEHERRKDTKDFTVVTDHRAYYFRADSAASAKEWVKTLQKVIFRSHNDGDSVKISLPVENVLDIEESPVVDFAETFKIRVIESGDSYAIDEYFFSFFSFGKDAFNNINTLIDDTSAKRISQDLLSPASLDGGDISTRSRSLGPRRSIDLLADCQRRRSTTPLRDSVRATLMPPSREGSGRVSPRLGGESPRVSRDPSRSSVDIPAREYGRASFDRGRRSESTSRFSIGRERRTAKSPLAEKYGSGESYVQSIGKDTESSLVMPSASTDTPGSASQILNDSQVFSSPTATRLDLFASANAGDVHGESLAITQSDAGKVNDTNKSSKPESRPAFITPRLRSSAVPSSAKALEDQPQGLIARNTSTPTLQDIVKAGSYPLQRAAGLAGYLKSRSSRMSKLLASESMGYIEKVSGMWTGGRKHYGENEGVVPDDRHLDPEDEEAAVGHGDRFRAHFALPGSEKLQATYFGYIHRVLPLYGKIYISNRRFCFRSLLPGTKTKLVLPLKDIENVEKEKGFRFGYHGLVLVIRGHEELFFEFSGAEHRDDCVVILLRNLESIKYMADSDVLAQRDQEEAEIAKAENDMLQEARREPCGNRSLKSAKASEGAGERDEAPPILFDDPRASIINFKPNQSLRVTCLTIGSRGDVQPYIALCKGFIAEGHRPRIATHAEFEPWVRKHGIDFKPVEGDPAELMRICVENGMFTYSFLKEASAKFRGWLDELLVSAWKACQDTDVLIESPSAMAGIHIAEALGIPYFRAFTMPWTRTRAYPHAFAVPDHKIGGAYNYFSYVMFDNVFWKAIASQVNRWRMKELGLRSTSLDKMQPNKVPFLYNFSPHVVPPPLDYSDWVRVTGYWFLDESDDWTPPEDLVDFIQRARTDGKKLVYIGFGSIVVSDPPALTKTVVQSVLKADVRCILSKGWSDRLGDPAAVKTEVPLPPEIHLIKAAPHCWLFSQIDAAVHHGGAGTTGASLRAGLPTIIKPFFGDQFFCGSRVEDLGVGICLKKVNVGVFSRALWEAVHSVRMIAKAKQLGENIRKEDGVAVAIQVLYRDLEYSRTLSKTRNPSLKDAVNATADEEDFGDEESWTFIGDESDPELQKRIRDWEPGRESRVSMVRRSVSVVQAIEPVVGKASKAKS